MNWERIPFCIPYNSLCRFMKLTQQNKSVCELGRARESALSDFLTESYYYLTKERLQILS